MRPRLVLPLAPAAALVVAAAVLSSGLPTAPAVPPGRPVCVALFGLVEVHGRDDRDIFTSTAPLEVQKRRVQALLTCNEHLELDGADCFEPGMDVIFGEGEDAIHVVVCLHCHKFHVATVDEEKLSLYYGLDDAGVREFKTLYDECFSL